MKFKDIEILKVYYENNHTRYVCKCICGKEFIRMKEHLTRSNNPSCGCKNGKHKMTGTKIYNIWHTMKRRCLDIKSIHYKNYGARGIKISKEWLDFSNFYKDMGVKPENKSLDRIDNNGNYCKENCRWATTFEQANNKRNNVFIEYEGNRYTQSQLARLLKVDNSTIRKRYRNLLIKVI